MIFACFLGSPSGGHFLIFCRQEAPKLELFGSQLKAFFENMKTVIFETPHTLQACGEGPKWYLFGYFFGACFRRGLRGTVFDQFSDFGGSFGRRFFTKKGGLKKGAKKVSLSRLKKLRNWGVGPLKEKDRRAEGEKDRRTEAGEPEHARVPEGTVADKGDRSL